MKRKGGRGLGRRGEGRWDGRNWKREEERKEGWMASGFYVNFEYD